MGRRGGANPGHARAHYQCGGLLQGGRGAEPHGLRTLGLLGRGKRGLLGQPSSCLLRLLLLGLVALTCWPPPLQVHLLRERGEAGCGVRGP